MGYTVSMFGKVLQIQNYLLDNTFLFFRTHLNDKSQNPQSDNKTKIVTFYYHLPDLYLCWMGFSKMKRTPPSLTDVIYI